MTPSLLLFDRRVNNANAIEQINKGGRREQRLSHLKGLSDTWQSFFFSIAEKEIIEIINLPAIEK